MRAKPSEGLRKYTEDERIQCQQPRQSHRCRCDRHRRLICESIEQLMQDEYVKKSLREVSRPVKYQAMREPRRQREGRDSRSEQQSETSLTGRMRPRSEDRNLGKLDESTTRVQLALRSLQEPIRRSIAMPESLNLRGAKKAMSWRGGLGRKHTSRARD